METTTVNNTQEAVTEILRQLQDKDWYMHNYDLLDSCQDYLDSCPDKDEPDFDKEEQLFNFLAYDQNWEDREDELFPMQL